MVTSRSYHVGRKKEKKKVFFSVCAVRKEKSFSLRKRVEDFLQNNLLYGFVAVGIVEGGDDDDCDDQYVNDLAE